jgi:hypothetical protein
MQKCLEKLKSPSRARRVKKRKENLRMGKAQGKNTPTMMTTCKVLT